MTTNHSPLSTPGPKALPRSGAPHRAGPGAVRPAVAATSGVDCPAMAPEPILLPALARIETERLRLVPPQAHHIPAYAAFIGSDRAAARGWAALPHEAWRSFAAILGHHLLRGFGPYVCEAKADGRALGLCGPWWPEGQPEQEIKWHIWAAADEGKGYAAEAACAMLAHAFGPLGWKTAVSYIAFDNDRSAALALRLGAVQQGNWTTPRGTTVRVFRHPAPIPAPVAP